MRENVLTISHTILVNKPRELVWDYTQNYDNRTAWDSSVMETFVLQQTPNRIVKLKLIGFTTMTFVYKLDERPIKTSLAAREITSPIIKNAGGSWTYEKHGEQTLWMQTNTIVFKRKFMIKLTLPFYKFLFNRLIKKAMKKAKREIEKL